MYIHKDVSSKINKILSEKKAFQIDCLDFIPFCSCFITCLLSFLSYVLAVPITNGRLNLGTWQGIWLCEHRNSGGRRGMVVTVQGSTSSWKVRWTKKKYVRSSSPDSKRSWNTTWGKSSLHFLELSKESISNKWENAIKRKLLIYKEENTAPFSGQTLILQR